MTQIITKNNNHIQTSFTTLLSETTKSLSRYLEKILPSLFDDWWNEAVLDRLSFQQRRQVDQRGIDSLTLLDLAALLRILDQNWYNISIKLNLSPEARHFVKEMQTIRNRWAHAGTEPFPVKDVYRDVDTLERFSAVIKADDTLIQEISATRKYLLTLERDVFHQEQTKEKDPLSSKKKSGELGIMKTQDIFDFVHEILNTIPEPWPGDIIEQVCLAIEREPRWLNRYNQLMSSHSKAIVNQMIGRHTFNLSNFNNSGPVQRSNSSIIKTYKWLS